MLFSSATFLFLYLPVVIGIYYAVPRKARNAFLLVANLVFYGWGEWEYAFLMLACALVNQVAGMIIEAKPRYRKVALVGALALSLGSLGYFKYAGFIARLLGLNLAAQIHLPLGISFYTFQALSYTIDVYRGTKAQRSFVNFAGYLTLFPQLVAGPIVRYSDVDDQLENRRENVSQFADGVRRFALGFAKKILLANAFGKMWVLVQGTDVGALGAWLGAAFCNPAFLRAGTMEGQAAIWLLHAPLCALPLYLAKRPDAARKTLPRLASAAIVVGFLAVVSLSGQKALALPKDILDMWTMLSILLIMAFLFLRLRRQYDTEKEVARLKSERAELLEREYAALNHAYAANAKLFHDTQNHLGALRQLLLHGKPAEALAYLDTLQAPVREIASDARTGDETLDYLIGSKAAAAQARGIAYQAQVEFPRRTNLRGADLCAIVGNLLDNAIEAAGQVPEPERRFVHLTIRRIHQMLVIKVENRFAAAPMEENGALKTTKTAGGLHGWGLKSAQAAAEKYDGTLQTSFTGDVFCSVATLSFQGVPESPPPQKGNS